MVLMKDPEDLHLSAAEIIVLAFNRTSTPGGQARPTVSTRKTRKDGSMTRFSRPSLPARATPSLRVQEAQIAA